MSMNEDIKEFGVFSPLGRKINNIKSTSDYNHYENSLHHYIKDQHYRKNPNWFKERGIQQKLIFMSVEMHNALHSGQSDKEFANDWGFSRHELLFNRKKSEY